MKAILTYHSIDPSESVISVSEEIFRRHVAWLASGRVRVTTIDELLRLPESADAVALTFDDGMQNFADVAAPLLSARALPATVFVVADHVGKTNAWGGVGDPGVPTLPLLKWEDLGRLAEQGVTLGAHSRTHPRLATMAPGALADEICGAATLIERHTGVGPFGFAYPYGSVTDAAASLVGAYYRWGCTTELRPLRPLEDAARLPRLDMFYFRQPGRLESWGTTRFDYYVKLRSHARRLRQRWVTRHAS